MNLTFSRKLVLLLCIVGLALTLWGVNYPFVGIYNANNNYLSLAAKNYLRFGFTNLKFFPTYFAGERLPSHVPYYLHHPVLIFPLSTIPFKIFGFDNWVVHATNFLFLIGDIFLLYKIATIVWSKKVGLWTAGLAIIFPMTTFFWKYIFFEQSSLFFNLCVFYFFIKYISQKADSRLRGNDNRTSGNDRINLFWIFTFTFLSGLVDWGVLYLFFPFIALYFTPYKKIVIKPFITYLIAAGISLSIFVMSVSILQGGFGELIRAISTRSYTAELTGLSLWPIRLVMISILRTLLYFTPVVIFWIFDEIGAWKKKKAFGLPEMTILFFLIFGLLNIFFLPTATWGHSYFLFYFIPLFSFLGAVWLVKIEKHLWITSAWVLVIVISSIGVNYLKMEQVKKQLWKYDAAVKMNWSLVPYETIGVANFAGDVLENYFLHPTKAMKTVDLLIWVQGRSYGELNHAIFACEGVCTTDEQSRVEFLKSQTTVVAYQASGNIAWLITKSEQQKSEVEQEILPTIKTGVKEGNIFLRIYRMLRDTLNVGQI